MNDRYLFRAKHVHALPGNEHLDGKWIEGYLSDENHIYSPSLEGEFLIDPDTICQCTGRNDEWEHDVFWCDDERYEIQFCEESLTWEAVSVFSSESIELIEFSPSEYVRLGNAIDNPELLEADHD